MELQETQYGIYIDPDCTPAFLQLLMNVSERAALGMKKSEDIRMLESQSGLSICFT